VEPQALEPGDILRKHRRAKGWTIADLAQASGINKATISAIENGQRFRSDTLATLMRALAMKTITMPPPPSRPDPQRLRLTLLFDSLEPEYQTLAIQALEEIQQSAVLLRRSAGARAELEQVQSELARARERLAETQRRANAARVKQAASPKQKTG
jgi:transcriptional regulator with XRE-family HTH domain